MARQAPAPPSRRDGKAGRGGRHPAAARETASYFAREKLGVSSCTFIEEPQLSR